MSNANQQTMIEYTNNLKGALEEAKEHAATLTTTQDKLLERINKQQQAMLEQNQKFMKMMTDLAEGNKRDDDNKNRRRSNRNKTEQIDPYYCKMCKKENQYHREEKCWGNPKNKDTRPNWYKDVE